MANLFGTLNRFISRLDAEPSQTLQQSPRGASTNNAHGFQVLANTALSSVPLEPYFDFIIGINGRTIDNPDPILFATEVGNCAGASISLGVWSAKGGAIREEYVLVPAKGEGGLGLSLQWTPLEVVEDVWHILDVIPNSPADVAGLLPYSDYVVGSPERLLRKGEGALGELVEAFMDQEMRLWVYNNEYDVMREIKLTPSRSWGGEGSLGCVLGFGALHRVPLPLTEPANAPGETMFESAPTAAAPAAAAESMGAPPASDFLVPANMPLKPAPAEGLSPAAAGPPPQAHSGRTKKQRAHHAVSPQSGMDEYFKEGEQKSQELEGGRSTPKTGGNLLPPPPKAGGGPPRANAPPPAAATTEETKREEEEAK